MIKTSDFEESSYQKSYQQVLKLHVITEFEKSEICINKIMQEPNFENSLKIFEDLKSEWNSRIQFLQPTPAVMEPVMSIRRILLEEIKQVCRVKLPTKDFDSISTNINAEIGQLWIKSTKYACKNKMFQQVKSNLLFYLTLQMYKK